MKSAHKLTFGAALKKYRNQYLMVAPFAIVFILFTVLPVAASIFLSFTSFNMTSLPIWTGLRNYITLIVEDDVFLTAIKNTLVFAILTGPLSYIMCFIFAWLINELPRIPRAIMTLVFYAPSISGNVYLVWKLIFSSDTYGYANAWLMKLGILQEPLYWLTTEAYIMPILIVVQIWMSLGVSFLSFIAGLQTVDRAMYEAGAVEGIKNRWQELWYITLPSMGPQLIFSAVMQIAGSFGVGTIVQSLAGFPTTQYSADTLLTYMLDVGKERYEMGYASAIAVFLFAMMLFTNFIVTRLIRRVGQ